jgi:RNA polymerase sigma-70 factor (ECF subfamily)
VADLDFEQVVNLHYATLYRFALSLTHNEVDASDLTQQTCYLWAMKGHQLRNNAKLKSWLLTTLHREFLGRRRHETRFQHVEVTAAGRELPSVPAEVVAQMDATALMQTLARVDEIYRVPLMLFYVEDMSYKEIAETLNVPVGTVMSRLARGKDQLRQFLAVDPAVRNEKLVALGAAAGKPKETHGHQAS